MKICPACCLLVAAAGGFLFAAQFAGSPAEPPKEAPKAPPAKGAAPAMPEMDAEMAAWMAAGIPGKQHEFLGKTVGTWEAKCTFWMAEGAPAMESKGSMVNTPVLGGRWIREEFKGDMMGESFEGIGYLGYDNVKKEYTSTWMDSMSTMMMTLAGQYDEKTKTLTSTGACKTPTGKEMKSRHVVTWKDDNTMMFTMYDSVGGAKERKCGEIIYTRKK